MRCARPLSDLQHPQAIQKGAPSLPPLCSAMAVRWEVDRWVRCGAQGPQDCTGTKNSRDAHNASPTSPEVLCFCLGHRAFPHQRALGFPSIRWMPDCGKGRRGFGPHAEVRCFALSPFSKSCEYRGVSLRTTLRQPAALAAYPPCRHRAPPAGFTTSDDGTHLSIGLSRPPRCSNCHAL